MQQSLLPRCCLFFEISEISYFLLTYSLSSWAWCIRECVAHVEADAGVVYVPIVVGMAPTLVPVAMLPSVAAVDMAAVRSVSVWNVLLERRP